MTFKRDCIYRHKNMIDADIRVYRPVDTRYPNGDVMLQVYYVSRKNPALVYGDGSVDTIVITKDQFKYWKQVV